MIHIRSYTYALFALVACSRFKIYILSFIEDEKSYEHLLPDVKDNYETVTDNNIGTLDPITGLYTLTATDNTACEPLNVDVCKETIINESIEENSKE